MEISYKLGFSKIEHPKPSWIVDKTVSDLATHYAWENGEYVTNWYLDYDSESPKIQVIGSNVGQSGNYSPKYYSSNNSLRLYASNVNNIYTGSGYIPAAYGQNAVLFWIPYYPYVDFDIARVKITFTSTSSSTGLFLAHADYRWEDQYFTRTDLIKEITSGEEITLFPWPGFLLWAGSKDAETLGQPTTGNIRITNIKVEYAYSGID